MDKLLRTLIENEEVSLVAVEAGQMVRHAQIIHGLTRETTRLLGRVLMTTCYMSCWLKDGDSELSVNVKQHGAAGEISASSNGEMHVRGYVYDPNATSDVVGKGYMTVIRDDGGSKPFLGTCELVDGDIDRNFEYYYRLSEQLPTFIKTDVSFDENGLCKNAGGIFLQPLPGASEKAVAAARADVEFIQNLGKMLDEKGMDGFLKEYFSLSDGKISHPEYRCKCSREYVAGVLHGMGQEELRDIIRTEGKINVHCHYCNSDYDFFDADVDAMFGADE